MRDEERRERWEENGERRKKGTYLFENLLAAILAADGMFDDGIVLAEVLVETGYAVEGEPDANEVYQFVEERTRISSV